MLYQYLTHRDNLHYIEGLHLLFLLQRLVNEAPLLPADGDGTLQAPWRFREAAQWMHCASKLTGVDDQYLVVGGRLLKKDKSRYISDQGPAWYSRVEAATSGNNLNGNANAIFGPPAAPPPPGMSAVPRPPVSPGFWELQSTAPNKAFGGNAPKYREVAENIVEPGRNLPENTENSRAAGLLQLHRPISSWAMATKQPALLRAMRAFLKNESALLLAPKTSSNVANYSRMQTMLPVLTAAMFLAEPSRNLRAFPVNLMLLDMASRGTYTLDQIVWHPYDLRIPGRQPYFDEEVEAVNIQGPVAARRQMAGVRKIEDMHLVGGVMPASPTKGGDLGKLKPSIPKNKGKLPQFAQFDYIHRKEISVLARWCQTMEPGTWRASGAIPQGATAVGWGDVVYQPRKNAHFYDELLRLQSKISSRTRSLDSM